MEFDEIVLKMSSQLTKQQAVELSRSNWWDVTGLAKAGFLQLNQPLLCMPFNKFHEAVSFLLGRSVYTHEFANSKNLIAEALGSKQSPSLQEIIDLLPPDKLIILKQDET